VDTIIVFPPLLPSNSNFFHGSILYIHWPSPSSAQQPISANEILVWKSTRRPKQLVHIWLPRTREPVNRGKAKKNGPSPNRTMDYKVSTKRKSLCSIHIQNKACKEQKQKPTTLRTDLKVYKKPTYKKEWTRVDDGALFQAFIVEMPRQSRDNGDFTQPLKSTSTLKWACSLEFVELSSCIPKNGRQLLQEQCGQDWEALNH